MSKTNKNRTIEGLVFDYENRTYKIFDVSDGITFELNYSEISIKGNSNHLIVIESLNDFYLKMIRKHVINEDIILSQQEINIINRGIKILRFRITNIYLKNLDLNFLVHFMRIRFILVNSVFEHFYLPRYYGFNLIETISIPENYIEEFLFGENFFYSCRALVKSRELNIYYNKYCDKKIQEIKSKYFDLIKSDAFLAKELKTLVSSEERGPYDMLKNIKLLEESLKKKSEDLFQEFSFF